MSEPYVGVPEHDPLSPALETQEPVTVHASTSVPPPIIDETPVISDSELMLVRQSWMEYPQPLSFEEAPALLDPKHPKNLNFLLVNSHGAVENEVHAVFDKVLTPLGLNATYTLTSAVGSVVANRKVTDEASREWFPSHTSLCDPNLYDLIVVGDVITYGRPFLTAACKTNIILYITNRFDFGVSDDHDYAQLMATASRWPNVRVMANNLWEQRYALAKKHADIHLYAYAPSTGTLTENYREHVKDGEATVDWNSIHQHEFVIIGRPNQMRLVQLMEEAGITPPTVVPQRHGGPLVLARRPLIHVPYQANTMSLFENINVGVLYVLPSLQLYESWLEQGHFTLDGGQTHEELLTYVDWYRTDLQFLFFYFDSLEDLAPSSEFRARVVREAEEKWHAMKQYMKYQTDRSVDAWRQALQSFPRLSDSTPIRRPADIPPPMPLMAELPDPVLHV